MFLLPLLGFSLSPYLLACVGLLLLIVGMAAEEERSDLDVLSDYEIEESATSGEGGEDVAAEEEDLEVSSGQGKGDSTEGAPPESKEGEDGNDLMAAEPVEPPVDHELPPESERTEENSPEEKADPKPEEGTEGEKEEEKKEEPETEPITRAEVDRALETKWLLRERTWNLDVFLRYAESFLKKYGEQFEWGAARFEMARDASDALVESVVIELENAPLLEAVEDICRQLKLRYTVERATNTVRFSRTGEGRVPGPKAKKRARVKSGPDWKFPPHAQAPYEAERLSELILQFQAESENRETSYRKARVLRDIGVLRTHQALRVLKTLAGDMQNESYAWRYLVGAVAEIDGAEAARLLLDWADKGCRTLAATTLEQGIGKLNTREAAEVLGRTGLGHGRRSVRLASAETLGKIGWTESLKPLAKAARSRCAQTRMAATRALARIGHPDALELLKEIVRKTDPASAAAALEGLGGPSSRDPLLGELALAVLERDKSLGKIIAAVRIVGANGDARAIDKLLPLLRSRDWRLRIAVIRALAEIRHEKAIGPLIERLDKEKGRLAYEVAQALHTLTGVDYGLDGSIWKKWWKDNEGKFIPPPILRPKISSHLTSAPAYYHNIPVVSKRIVFILDISGSMSTPMDLKNPAKGAPEEGSRLDYCCWEMWRTIQKLSKDVWFNIISFESQTRPWKKTVIQASPKNKGGAKKFLDGQRPIGGTNLFDALKEAFKDRHADTLYVLSDGSPNGNPDEIRRWVRENNRTRFFVIHTISAGRSYGEFMQKLAEENGGKAVRLE
jgi:HEAT repeat protein